MRATDIRRSFLDFFAERGHKIWPSASLVPEDPRAPLLTTAGMVQFIPYFYGEKVMEPPRAASCQVSARTTDIENVGLTHRHMTTFEMLGNFSFGDYFKQDAIKWAWVLSTAGYGLDPERIWITVYETDDEAFEIWRDDVGVPATRIVRCGKDDNFWAIASGPGGPCSELFYDRGPAFGDVEGFEAGDRITEFWNLVFTQYEVDESAEPVGPLPRKNVDTGMGLDRLARLLQDVPTVFDTDLMRPVVARAEELTGRVYGSEEMTDIRLRIMADHFRAATFMVGDGIMPSNEDRGYILRRLLRRAVRHGKLLGVDEVIAPRMVDAVIGTMGEAYPDLAANRAFIEQVLESEEGGFRATLTRGTTLLDDAIAGARQSKAAGVPGETAFKLHDTYGFPFELTLEIVQEAGLDIDRAEFERLMDEQRERARHARKELAIDDTDALRRVLASHGASTFVGYDRTQEEAKVLAVVREGALIDGAREGDEIELVLDATPFYPEGGGQIGDAGVIETDGARVEVLDTQKRLGDLIVHVARVTVGEITAGIPARASVD
ncbi:MAG TPA: alanine--tRNA ligase, partial [Actinomycetota bacterium]